MASKKGVFIHSVENLDDIIQACKNLIENSIAEGKIEAAVPDDKYGGIKLYLNRDEVMQKFLDRRFLLKENGETLATVHPLSTQLIVREAKFLLEKEEFLEKLILDNLDIKYHQILEISNIPFSDHHPDVLTTDLRVILDVPEIEELYVFKDAGFPNDLEIPIGTQNELLSLNFYCPRCNKGGHTSWSCPKSIGCEVALNSSPESPSIAEAPHTPKSRNSLPSHERETTKEINILSPKKVDVSKFAVGIGTEVARYFNTFYPNTPGSSKISVGVSSSPTLNRSLFSDRDDPKNEPTSKKARTLLQNNEQEQSEDISKANNGENNISIHQPSVSTKNAQHLSQASEGIEPDMEVIYNVNLGNISPNPGPSSLQAIRIPPRIKEMWEPLCYFQSIERLETFLDHSKSRQNLRKITPLYDDMEHHVLKEHLINLRKAYYNEKKPLNKETYKEEKEFMNWFEGLILRMG